ncbi:HutD family protein [Paenalcaligenes niemegkensis]|uniref:HutD/Ves family protein n=1 Tax=Paenalcaligenes niemegkensis TaxID=2895469 RepID=UPI001EE80BD2|nr:HutD family protein [Paenalcaligenes niemegkensis]MCQ9617734.1 HutD family protein [Paenalcaligenes niemegkensis]
MHHSERRSQPSLNDPDAFQLIPAVRLQSVPWKNGGGSTKEIIVSPEGAQIDDFLWRVSIAEVKTEGEFSVFPDIQRNISLLKGESMVLNNRTTGLTHSLFPLRPFDFDGEHQIAAFLPDGPTLDFNVMVRRSARLQAHVALLEKDACVSADASEVLLYCAEGPCVLKDTHHGTLQMSSGDSLYFKNRPDHEDDSTRLQITDGRLLCVSITTPHHKGARP